MNRKHRKIPPGTVAEGDAGPVAGLDPQSITTNESWLQMSEPLAPLTVEEWVEVVDKLTAHAKALTTGRDEYKRKYELVMNDADYSQCCAIRMAREAERDAAYQARDNFQAGIESMRQERTQLQREYAKVCEERDALKEEVVHYRDACASVGETDGHGWAETTNELRAERDALQKWKRIILGTGTDQEAVIRLAATEYTKIAVESWKRQVADLTRLLAEAKAIQAIDLTNNNEYREQVASLKAALAASEQAQQKLHESLTTCFNALLESHPERKDFVRQLESGELERRLLHIGPGIFDPTGRVRACIQARQLLKEPYENNSSFNSPTVVRVDGGGGLHCNHG